MRHRLLFLALIACALLACDSANPVAPTGSVLSVNANPSQIGLSGTSSRITVTGFKPDGNPLNPGTQILLSTDLGDLFDSSVGGNLVSTIEVGSNGQATAFLRGDGRQGPAMITATLTTGGDATASTSVQIGETVESRLQVIVDANPTIIPTNGTSRVTILVRNNDNTPVGAGQRVRLTADLGTLVADGGSAGDPEISQAITDANGEAFVTFVAGDRAGAGEVAAIAGTSEEATVAITIRSALDSLDLTANPQTIQRLDAGETIELQVVVNDAQGLPIPSVLIRFDTLGSLSNNPVPTNSQGVATATLTVRAIDVQTIPQNGMFGITATGTSEGVELSDTEQVTVLGAP